MNKYRLRQSVAIVAQDGVVEFFKSNTRESIKIKINSSNIIELLKKFDGKTDIESIIEKNPLINLKQLENLASYLNKENILIIQDCLYPDETINKKYRMINTFEDFCHTTTEVLNCFERINSAQIMIVGMGAVGSNIAAYLAHCGVGTLIFVDHDKVDISNLHRQYYFESDLNKNKNEALVESLKEISPDINIISINDIIDDSFFNRNLIPSDVNLIINCADEPNVDYTSKIIASYCMNHRIPHIVGGGYNLHQTLIGQTIIPFESACFNCFKKYLDKINTKELIDVKKLHRTKRKLGSYSPLSGLAASLASLDAIKLICGNKRNLQQLNKRVEFSLRTFSFNIQDVPRDPQCEWCGEK